MYERQYSKLLQKLVFTFCHAGDGFTCNPNAQLAGMAARYVTDGEGRVACSEGSNLAHPVGSPGLVDDPTGSVQATPSHAVRAHRVLV